MDGVSGFGRVRFQSPDGGESAAVAELEALGEGCRRPRIAMCVPSRDKSGSRIKDLTHLFIGREPTPVAAASVDADDWGEVDVDSDDDGEVDDLLGRGSSASVTRSRCGGRDSAIKSGELGPYEALLARCGSPYLPEVYSVEVGRIEMECVPNGVPIAPAMAAPVAVFISKAMKDVRGRVGPFQHCDIKTENMRITSEGDLRLLDWGSARPNGFLASLAPEATPVRGVRAVTNQNLGTPEIAPPEAWGNLYTIGEGVDAWGTGMTMFRLLRGGGIPHPLYEGDQPSEQRRFDASMLALHERDEAVIKRFNDAIDDVHRGSSVEPRVIEVMKRLLKVEVSERLLLEDVPAFLATSE